MEKTTSRKLARARLVERHQAAAAAREARERANIGDLTEFMVRSAQIEEVDTWLEGRVEKVRAEADQRRQRHRVAAGKALHAMRLRGETITQIATQTGLSQGRVREFLRIGADTATEDTAPVAVVQEQVVALPNGDTEAAIGHQMGDGAADTQ